MAAAVTIPKFSSKIIPLGDQVVVMPIEAEQVTASGIVIPDTAKEKKSQEGVVLALGKGGLKKDDPIPTDHLSIGDRVLFGKYAGEDVTLKDEKGKDVELKILSLDSIRAVLS